MAAYGGWFVNVAKPRRRPLVNNLIISTYHLQYLNLILDDNVLFHSSYIRGPHSV